MPSERIPQLRSHLDRYARERLTLADFEPILHYDAELALELVTPDFFQLLERLQPFGVGNAEPVFVACGARLLGAPRVFKEEHVKLKFAAAKNGVVHTALGWRMADTFQQQQCLAGDLLDIAFTLDHNDHPDFGGLELTLKDFRRAEAA